MMNVQNQDFEFSGKISVLRYPKLQNVVKKNFGFMFAATTRILIKFTKTCIIGQNIGARNYFEQF